MTPSDNAGGTGSLRGVQLPAPRTALGISVAAAVVVIGLKWAAWWTTGSVGFLSDAMHSLVNLGAASFALLMVFVARRPPSPEYPYGFGKAEYFSAAFEGGLICAAAVAIVYAVIQRILHPQPLQPLGLGTALSATGATINGAVAHLLVRVGRKYRSAASEGDGRHLMADVWITAGVIVGVGIAGITGWSWPDYAAGLLVAGNLARVGWKLISSSLSGLLDAAWPEEDIHRLKEALDACRPKARSSRLFEHAAAAHIASQALNFGSRRAQVSPAPIRSQLRPSEWPRVWISRYSYELSPCPLQAREPKGWQ